MDAIVVLPNNTLHNIRVQGSDLISDLKRKIGTKSGLDMTKHNLNYGAMLLDERDTRTLQQIGIEDESMIHVVAAHRGGRTQNKKY